MPANAEAERMVLGCILLDNALLADAAAQISASDFFTPSNAKVFRAMGSLHERTGAIDPLSLKDELRASGELDAVGGAAYVAGLLDGVPRFPSIDAYLRLVKDAATSRALIALGNQVMRRALDDSELPDAQLAQVRYAVDQIEAKRTVAQGMTGGAAVNEYLHKIKTLQDSGRPFLGVATGLTELDYTLGGLQRGDLIIIGARPSMGKTSAAARMVQGIAESPLNERGQIVVFSLEMSRVDFAARLACGIVGLNSERARNGQLNRNEWALLAEAEERIASWPLTIFGSEDGTSVQAHGALLRQLQREHGAINGVFVDHLGFCTYAGYDTDKLTVLFDRITKYQKQLAKQFNVPFVILSQLSRANEARGNKRPMLSDLRDSGAIEQQADVVIFPHRENYYDKNAPEDEAEWAIAKQRNGALRTLTLKWTGRCAWFDNQPEAA